MEEFPMAKIISIEMTLSQMKVAEMDVKGKKPWDSCDHPCWVSNFDKETIIWWSNP